MWMWIIVLSVAIIAAYYTYNYIYGQGLSTVSDDVSSDVSEDVANTVPDTYITDCPDGKKYVEYIKECVPICQYPYERVIVNTEINSTTCIRECKTNEKWDYDSKSCIAMCTENQTHMMLDNIALCVDNPDISTIEEVSDSAHIES